MKLTMKAAMAVVCLTLTLCAGVSLGQSDEEYEIFRLVNTERFRQRLRPLEWDDDVASLARNYSRQMARGGFFGHYDAKGRTVVERAEQQRVRGWSKIGENLFMCGEIDGFERYSVRGWLKSPSHRKNMLDRQWSSTGIGVYRSNDGRIYVTQVFIA